MKINGNVPIIKIEPVPKRKAAVSLHIPFCFV